MRRARSTGSVSYYQLGVLASMIDRAHALDESAVHEIYARMKNWHDHGSAPHDVFTKVHKLCLEHVEARLPDQFPSED